MRTTPPRRPRDAFAGWQGVFLRLADASACIISAMAVGNELMASNARRSRKQNQSPAREQRPPNPANGLASRATDSTQSKPLSGALRELLSDPLSGPAIVCLQAGNVNTGAFDPAAEICARAHLSGAWVHVDGAFGLWAAASPKYAHLVDGVADADSWATDAHKWLNVPYDSGLAFVREPEPLRAAMGVTAAYLPDTAVPATARGILQHGLDVAALVLRHLRDPRPGGGPDLPLLERPAGVSGDFLSRPIQLGSIAQSYRYVSTSGALGIRSRGRGDDRATIRRLYSFRAAYDAATM